MLRFCRMLAIIAITRRFCTDFTTGMARLWDLAASARKQAAELENLPPGVLK